MTALKSSDEATRAELPRPKLRGLIHLIMSPVSLVAGLVLIAVADKMKGRITLGIFTLLIAGTYTPFAIFLLNKDNAIILLAIIWSAALLTSILRITWLNAPRWLYVIAYVGLGWAAVVYLPEFWQKGGVAVCLLILAGGACYTAGGIIYALKKPNFSINWFGFHELFHALTAAAFVFQFVAAGIVVYSIA